MQISCLPALVRVKFSWSVRVWVSLGQVPYLNSQRDPRKGCDPSWAETGSSLGLRRPALTSVPRCSRRRPPACLCFQLSLLSYTTLNPFLRFPSLFPSCFSSSPWLIFLPLLLLFCCEERYRLFIKKKKNWCKLLLTHSHVPSKLLILQLVSCLLRSRVLSTYLCGFYGKLRMPDVWFLGTLLGQASCRV